MYRAVTLTLFSTLLLTAPSPGWSAGGPDPVHLVSLRDSGAHQAGRSPDGQVSFRNESEGTTRLILSRRDASAFACQAPGEEVSFSRSGQFVLQSGATLTCNVAPGRYRYTTLRHSDGRIRESRATLDVRR
jgi:hypothetical protein